jgi:acetylornithine deacetylase/succinyl-diaminopimelate desuccinylase family protein
MREEDRSRIAEAVLADKADIVAFTQDLVAIPSENPPGAFYKPCVHAIASKLTELGIDFELVSVPGCESDSSAEYPRYAILACQGGGDPQLHFHGHYDVVPVTSDAQFRPHVKEGNLYGRGSSDMKSGLASMIYAIKAIRTCEIELSGSIRLTIVPDEETGGALGSKYLSEAGLIGSSGIGMLTAEPTSGVIWNASRGAVSLLISVKGTPMHVGLHYDGVNAFDNMVVVANALTELKREVEDRVTEYNIQPEAARRSILMLGGRCEGGTNFNLVPGECSFTVDRRINPEEDLHAEKQRLSDVLDGLRDTGIDLEIEVLQEGGSAGVSEENPVARALSGNIERIAGKRPEFEMCPGLLEIRFYAANGIPAFAYGPGLLSVSHGPQEYVPIKNIVDCTAIYALTACDVLAA